MYTLMNGIDMVHVPYVLRVDPTAEAALIKTEKETFDNFEDAKSECLRRLQGELKYLQEKIDKLKGASEENCKVFKL